MDNIAINGKQSLVGRMPPQSIESEQALLGGILLDKEAIWRVVDFVEPGDFYKPGHQKIYQAVVELVTKREPVDIRTVASRLQEKKELQEIGGYGYLAELANSVPTASNIFAYAKNVQKKRILRDLIEASYEISRLGYNEQDPVETVLDRAEKSVFAIAQRGVLQKFTSLKAGLKSAWQRIEQLAGSDANKLSGIATGFRALDNYLAGLQKSDLIILASRPSYGKSSLALNIALHAAMNSKAPVGVFSLEMSNEQVVDRFIASQSRIDLWRIRTGRLSRSGSPSDFDVLNQALGALAEAPIFVDDSSSPTVLQIKAMARRLQAECGLGLLIVDYLQLIQPLNVRDSVVQQVTEISRALKDLARELRIPVLALSQLSRAVEQRHPPIPRLADLRESGSIEQDSDVVMFINRPDKYDKNAPGGLAEIIIAKHRNGPTGRVQLRFREPIVTFEELTEEDISAAQEEIAGGLEELG